MRYFDFYQTQLNGLLIVEPHISFNDNGYSMITYNDEFASYVRHIDGRLCSYVQDNESKSKKGVLRGIHTQLKYPQGKLVRVTYGEVFDAVVDVRKDSPSFGEWFGIRLSSINRKMFLIPEGFLHGFLVLSDEAVFQYKCTRNYIPEDEIGVLWDDPEIGINWPIELSGAPAISEKDRLNNVSFSRLREFIMNS